LLARAQAAGKIERGWRIPDAYRRNTAVSVGERFPGELRAKLPHFPLSTDFTPEEARLAVALDYLKTLAGSKRALAGLWLTASRADASSLPLLERMGLDRARILEERINRRILLGAIARTNEDRPVTSRSGAP
jgi:hypothetical protein